MLPSGTASGMKDWRKHWHFTGSGYSKNWARASRPPTSLNPSKPGSDSILTRWITGRLPIKSIAGSPPVSWISNQDSEESKAWDVYRFFARQFKESWSWTRKLYRKRREMTRGLSGVSTKNGIDSGFFLKKCNQLTSPPGTSFGLLKCCANAEIGVT